MNKNIVAILYAITKTLKENNSKLSMESRRSLFNIKEISLDRIELIRTKISIDMYLDYNMIFSEVATYRKDTKDLSDVLVLEIKKHMEMIS